MSSSSALFLLLGNERRRNQPAAKLLPSPSLHSLPHPAQDSSSCRRGHCSAALRSQPLPQGPFVVLRRSFGPIREIKADGQKGYFSCPSKPAAGLGFGFSFGSSWEGCSGTFPPPPVAAACCPTEELGDPRVGFWCPSNASRAPQMWSSSHLGFCCAWLQAPGKENLPSEGTIPSFSSLQLEACPGGEGASCQPSAWALQEVLVPTRWFFYCQPLCLLSAPLFFSPGAEEAAELPRACMAQGLLLPGFLTTR